MVATEMLRRAGYDVMVASDGEEALRLLGDEVVDLIVCDAMMPRMTGPQLIEALRAAGDRTPIVLMSGQNQQGATATGTTRSSRRLRSRSPPTSSRPPFAASSDRRARRGSSELH